MKIHYRPNLKTLARKLRKQSTLGEVLLWREIKGSKLGCRFLRQVPIQEYILDFYCAQLHLAIEIDGAASHNQKVDQDKVRQREIEGTGIKIIRFSENDVRYNIYGVVITIRSEIQNKSLTINGPLPFLKGD